MAIYMESWLSKKFSFLEFGIKVEHDGNYALEIKFMLQMINSFLFFIYLQKVVTVSWILSWLHWMYDYTLLAYVY